MTPKDLFKEIKACRFAYIDNKGKETIIPSKKPHLRIAEKKFLEDKNGITPLMSAVYTNNLQEVKSILDSEKDIDLEAKNQNGLTALSIASAKGRLEIVSELFKHGARIDTRDNWTYSPFLWACNEGHDSVVKFLLANGANPDDEESLHNSALMRACVRGHENIVKILLIAGANPNSKNVLGFGPLIEAVGHPKPEICALLIGYGADINATDYGTHGCKSALMWAAQLGRKEIIKVLLNLGADTSLSTCKAVDDQPAGMTAIDFAENAGHFHIAQMIKKSYGK